MANVKLKSSNYFGLVIRNNCKALFVREDKTSLFHFPGSSIESKKGIKDKLASLLSRKYEGRVLRRYMNRYILILHLLELLYL